MFVAFHSQNSWQSNYKGKIFDASEDKVLVNLGLFDGYIDLKETRLKDNDFHIDDFADVKIERFDYDKGLFYLNLL